MSIGQFGRGSFYTVEQFAALPEDNSMRYELDSGYLVASPRPHLNHMIVAGRLCAQLDRQLPNHLLAVQEIDVMLLLDPPIVRIPDLVVLHARAVNRQRLVTAEDVVLAVEVLSPGSLKIDTVVKPLEYADAGIPNLWLVDPKPPVTVSTFTLVDGEFEESQRAEHALTTAEPCPLRVDLDSLLPAVFG